MINARRTYSTNLNVNGTCSININVYGMYSTNGTCDININVYRTYSIIINVHGTYSMDISVKSNQIKVEKNLSTIDSNASSEPELQSISSFPLAIPHLSLLFAAYC